MTSILDAASSATIAEAAMKYLEAACSIVPVTGKKPAVALAPLIRQQPPRTLVRHWLAVGTMKGIGVLGGAVSGGLVLLDVDSMDACGEFEATFPALIDTLTVRSGSGRGKHYYFYAHRLPGNAYRGGIEMRCTGAYVVAPPSVHPTSGQPYRVERFAEVRRVYSMASVRRWILERGGGGAAAAPRRAPTPLPPQARDSSAYGRAALMGECAAVRTAAEGQGNNTLYKAALKLGTLVADGKIERLTVEIELENSASALSERDGVEATRRTIQSGLRTGMNNRNTRQGA